MLKGFAAAVAALIATTALGAGGAQARVVIGSVYLNNAAATNATIGFSHGAADVTFSVPTVNSACGGPFGGDTLCFNSSLSKNGYTVGGFLATGGATILTGSASALSSVLDNSVIEFTGTVTVTQGQSFQAGHDDGLQLKIGDQLVIDSPGPTGFTTTPATYNGPSGTFAFDLVYGECCGDPALLAFGLPIETTNAPEPASLALVSAGVLGLAAIRRRARPASVRA